MMTRRDFGGLTVLPVVLATSIVHIAGCTTDESVSQTAQASTVADYASTGCSTAVVIGLSKQIAQEADCEHPGNFVAFTATGGITITSSAVLPYLDKSARDDLVTVAGASPVQVNSALRTLAQQYLLYAWYQQGRCGITAAATVGNSNHEGGRAVDLANYSSRISAMAAHGWAHDVPGDDVHFDHTASTDHRGEDVHAFQVLWNKNHPNDTIGEDGSYGPQTEARLKMSPADGFAIGPSCGTTTPQNLDLDVVSIAGPDRAAPATQVHYGVTVKNTGNVTWPATTQLIVKSGAASALYDPSWMSPTVVTALGASVDAGQTATVDFDVTTPAEDTETPVMEAFQLADGSAKFGEIDLAVTVVPGETTGGSSSDGGDKHDSGCNAGGGGAGWVLAIGVIFVRRRRRS